ncbi:MAG TPA: zf-HC2 domain-containing protein [candidate division Zixibacteria bacterium]|nr:zf-HC2 domain-containing protein [candidate division Zixibacteria bacterium]
MDCTYFQELLSAMKDGELTKDEELRLVEHLRACDACRRFATELADTSKLLTSLEPDKIPPEIEHRILDVTVGSGGGAKDQSDFWRGSYTVPKKLAWAVAAVLALLIVNSGVQFIRGESTSQPTEAIRGGAPTVQHIVLTDRDVVASYTRVAEDKH